MHTAFAIHGTALMVACFVAGLSQQSDVTVTCSLIALLLSAATGAVGQVYEAMVVSSGRHWDWLIPVGTAVALASWLAAIAASVSAILLFI